MVSISFFNYKGFKNRWWAFQQMGRVPASLKDIKGLTFGKLLGSGGKTGFSIFPNFGLYALVCVWESESLCQDFLQNHFISLNFKKKSKEYQHIFLNSLSSHGKWDGQEPFENPKTKTNNAIAVITRAKIKLNRLWQFWRFVRPASRDMQNKEGLFFSVGIGELPFIQQATFSIWKNTEKMVEYAYKSPQHKKVIQKTRELNWYSEELFARFEVIATEGNMKAFEQLTPLLESQNKVIIKQEH